MSAAILPDDPAGGLLASLASRVGVPTVACSPPDGQPAAMRWARSGLALLTGHEGKAPALPARDFAGRLDALAGTVEALAGRAGRPIQLDRRLFAERAAELGLSRRGRISCNGTARILPTADGWIAVNLARVEDRLTVPAWIGCALNDDPWTALEAEAPRRATSDLIEGGRLLGLPVAAVDGADDEQWRARGRPVFARHGSSAERREINRDLVVIDLSSLWAGPLCGQVLTALGARVIKVESRGRPDGARRGPPAFYDRLHHGQESVAVDFTTPEGRAALTRLLARADVVIEGARPRALEQLGVDLGGLFRARPGLVWVSITAYGRSGPWRQGVGFGDETAAAAGLVVWSGEGAPCFVGDALADPAAGLMAAAGALAALFGGGGFLVDVALREAAAFVADAEPVAPEDWGVMEGDEGGGWRLRLGRTVASLAPPSARPETGRAPKVGEDNAAIFDALA